MNRLELVDTQKWDGTFPIALAGVLPKPDSPCPVPSIYCVPFGEHFATFFISTVALGTETEIGKRLIAILHKIHGSKPIMGDDGQRIWRLWPLPKKPAVFKALVLQNGRDFCRFYRWSAHAVFDVYVDPTMVWENNILTIGANPEDRSDMRPYLKHKTKRKTNGKKNSIA